MDSTKLPTDELGKLIHVVEECAEVQKAISKLIRFGFDAHNPNDPKKVPNVVALLAEIDDLQRAIERVRPTLKSGAMLCGWDEA
jgi:hypothetical protein